MYSDVESFHLGLSFILLITDATLLELPFVCIYSMNFHARSTVYECTNGQFGNVYGIHCSMCVTFMFLYIFRSLFFCLLFSPTLYCVN